MLETPFGSLFTHRNRWARCWNKASLSHVEHMAKDKSAAECTRACVKQSTKYPLVVGKKVYTLEGHDAELDRLAGMKATVKGKLSGETVAVQSVVLAICPGVLQPCSARTQA